jgi:hypothetical protein
MPTAVTSHGVAAVGRFRRSRCGNVIHYNPGWDQMRLTAKS